MRYYTRRVVGFAVVQRGHLLCRLIYLGVRRPQSCRLLLHHRWAGKKAGLLFCNLPKHRQAAAPRSHTSSSNSAGDREGVLSMLRLHEHHAFLQTGDCGPCHAWASYAMHTAVPLCAASGVLSCSVKCQLCRLRRRGGIGDSVKLGRRCIGILLVDC